VLAVLLLLSLLALLISPEARDVLDRHGIELISYRQL
jgi:hypothetical protein